MRSMNLDNIESCLQCTSRGGFERIDQIGDFGPRRVLEEPDIPRVRAGGSGRPWSRPPLCRRDVR